MKKSFAIILLVLIAILMAGSVLAQGAASSPVPIKITTITLTKMYTEPEDSTQAIQTKEVYGYFKVITYPDPFGVSITFFQDGYIYEHNLIVSYVDEGLEFLVSEARKNIIFVYDPIDEVLAVCAGESYATYDVIANDKEYLVKY